MPLDHYVTLGRSGLRVSPFCLGAMTFGEDLGWGSSVEESEAIIDRYLELGGNFVDTANLYTKGHSEKICCVSTKVRPRIEPMTSGQSEWMPSPGTIPKAKCGLSWNTVSGSRSRCRQAARIRNGPWSDR